MDTKTVVIYKSKYGSTKKYSAWIAMKLNADLYEVKDISPSQLNEYDTVIYGGGVYAGKINGIRFISKNISKLQDKKVIVFAVGIESNLYNAKELLISNLNEDISKDIDTFRFLGDFDYKNLTLFDKTLMNALKVKISKKEKLTQDDKLILKGFEEKLTLCDKKAVSRLIDSINKNQKKGDGENVYS